VATVKYQGKSYETKRQLAEALSINYDTLNMRMSRGLPLSNAVDFKPKSTVIYNNKQYSSYQHLIDALKLKLTVNQLQYRLKKCGGSLDKAVYYQVPGTAVVFKGVAYPSLKKLCDKLGLVYSTVKNRINRQAKSIEEAISMSVKGTSTRGRKPKSATASKAKAKVTVAKAKKPVAKKATVKKAVAKKPAAKKATVKKAVAKKPAAKKAVAKKTVAKKATVKKATVKKVVAKRKPAKAKAAAPKATAKRKVGRPRKASS